MIIVVIMMMVIIMMVVMIIMVIVVTSLCAGSLPRHWLAATTVDVVASPARRKVKGQL